MGLIQDQGVHALSQHLIAFLRHAKEIGLEKVFIHCFTDGRDTPPRSTKKFISEIEEAISSLGIGAISTLMGRYFAMDRDNNWDRNRIAYEALVYGKGNEIKDPKEAVEEFYNGKFERMDASLPLSDEFIDPLIITGDDGTGIGLIEEGDCVINFNYRQDRARQISKVFCDSVSPLGEKFDQMPIKYFGLTRYYDEFENYLIPPMKLENLLGPYIDNLGFSQLRITETQKFKHVTSFFNGKIEEPSSLEERILVKSLQVAENKTPEMRAWEITQVVTALMVSGKEKARKVASSDPYVITPPSKEYSEESSSIPHDLIIINFANGDMVGHTGDFQAAMKAASTVDQCVKEICMAGIIAGASVIVTSDHGNLERMMVPETGAIQTAHTEYNVDCIFVSEYSHQFQARETVILADIAPTILKFLEVKKPFEMTGDSIFVKRYTPSLSDLSLGSIEESLINTLKESDSSKRAQAALALGDLEDGQSESLLIFLTNDPDTQVRQNAIGGLGKRQSLRAISSITNLVLNDEESEVRKAAHLYLAQIDSDWAIPFWIRATIEEKDEEVQKIIKENLNKYKNDSFVKMFLETSPEKDKFDL